MQRSTNLFHTVETNIKSSGLFVISLSQDHTMCVIVVDTPGVERWLSAVRFVAERPAAYAVVPREPQRVVAFELEQLL